MSDTIQDSRKQKDRIKLAVASLCPEGKLIFEDEGLYFRFMVTSGEVRVIESSGHRDSAFYESMSDEKLATFIKVLAGGRLGRPNSSTHS